MKELKLRKNLTL